MPRKKPKTYKGRPTKREKNKQKLLFQIFILAIIVFLLTGYLHGMTYLLEREIEGMAPYDVKFQATSSLEKSLPPEPTDESSGEEKRSQGLSEPHMANAIIREVSAYNAGDPFQCDSSPCIAANGENICTALALGFKRCATNAYPLGTRLLIDGYGECLVVDRMNSRYQNRVDVALQAHEKERAIAWGLQRLKVSVIK